MAQPLYHQAREFLDPDKILLEGEALERRPEFAQFVRRHDELCLSLRVQCGLLWRGGYFILYVSQMDTGPEGPHEGKQFANGKETLCVIIH